MDATDPSEGKPAGEGTRRRRRVPVIPVLVLLAILGGLAFLVVARSSPEQQVRRLIDRQIKLALAGKFGQLHATLSPDAKAACPRLKYIGDLSGLRVTEPDFWHLIDIRNINVRVTGDRAEVTYVVTYNGRVVERATPQNPDLYMRATETVLGPKPDLKAALAILETQHSNLPGIGQQITDKQYEAQKARLEKLANTRPVVWKKGQWYDDFDRHFECET
jgi:hypothetical protein